MSEAENQVELDLGDSQETEVNFPDQEESILNIMAHLDRLRRRTENKFPDARAFVRPGFDEIDEEKLS